MNNTLEDFYSVFMTEIELASEQNESGWEKEDFLSSVMLEYLEEASEVNDYIICPFRDRGLQMNAYAINEDFNELELYVTIYVDSDRPKNVQQKLVDAAIKRAIQLYHKAVNDLYSSFEKDNDTYEFAITIHDHADDIRDVKIFALTNGLVKPIDFNNIELGNANVSFGIWDIDRLFRCVTSGKMREVIEIDFEEKFGLTIPCIENTSSDKYSVYLAILNGDLLADLYDEYRDRLLEKNVRSFLQVRGAVNKGIRDTLKNEPTMFLAYNNGISVTAESVTIARDDNGKPSIKSIKDMQVVNGGQTTASIYNAKYDKRNPVDVSKVYVQMKLSVISNQEDVNVIVPKISEYANTQNKVQIADFSANDPFHRKLEDLSRTIWSPSVYGSQPINWFYERARGQYADMLSRESTPKKRKQYKETHPLFSKTDMAKYENTWDQLPYYVSEGAQKNFKRFTVRLNNRKGFMPDEEYYKNLIAKAIMFKSTEKLVSLQKFGGYRANIVTYTLAFLSYKTSQRINLDSIWKEQRLSPALEQEIINISGLAHDYITNPPGGKNISEWCKKEKCWDTFKQIDYKISEGLEKELISLEYVPKKTLPVKSIDSNTEEEEKVIAEAMKITPNTWFALSKWTKETRNFQPWQRSLVFKMGTIVGRNQKPSYKQSVQGLKVYNESLKKGFNNPE